MVSKDIIRKDTIQRSTLRKWEKKYVLVFVEFSPDLLAPFTFFLINFSMVDLGGGGNY